MKITIEKIFLKIIILSVLLSATLGIIHNLYWVFMCIVVKDVPECFFTEWLSRALGTILSKCFCILNVTMSYAVHEDINVRVSLFWVCVAITLGIVLYRAETLVWDCCYRLGRWWTKTLWYNVKYVSVSCPKLYTEFSSVALGTVNVSRFILLLSVPLVSSMFWSKSQ
jgi:hypothetical protein